MYQSTPHNAPGNTYPKRTIHFPVHENVPHRREPSDRIENPHNAVNKIVKYGSTW